MYKMRKTRIDVKVYFAAHANTCEAARLDIKDRHDNLSNITNNDGKAKIDSLNVEKVEFDI